MFYTIPKLSKETGIPARTLRDLARRNLLRPAIYSGSRRYYTIDALAGAVEVEVIREDYPNDQSAYDRIAQSITTQE